MSDDELTWEQKQDIADYQAWQAEHAWDSPLGRSIIEGERTMKTYANISERYGDAGLGTIEDYRQINPEGNFVELVDSLVEKMSDTPGDYEVVGIAYQVEDELPPDPEGMNEERAERAAEAMRHYPADEEDLDPQYVLKYFLTDLMHWCDRVGVNFEDALSMAQYNYNEETAPE